MEFAPILAFFFFCSLQWVFLPHADLITHFHSICHKSVCRLIEEDGLPNPMRFCWPVLDMTGGHPDLTNARRCIENLSVWVLHQNQAYSFKAELLFKGVYL